MCCASRQTALRRVLQADGPATAGSSYAPEDPDDAMPEDLSQVCCQARKQGAEYVLLDCDALPMEDLPVLHPDFTAG